MVEIIFCRRILHLKKMKNFFGLLVKLLLLFFGKCLVDKRGKKKMNYNCKLFIHELQNYLF